MNEDDEVTLFVHDGPVNRATTPQGFWYALPTASVEWDAETRTVQIIGAS